MLVAIAAMLVPGVLGAVVRLVAACIVAAARVVAARVVAAVLAAASALVAHIADRRLLLPANEMLLTATQISSEECEERRERRRKATSVGHSSDILLYPCCCGAACGGCWFGCFSPQSVRPQTVCTLKTLLLDTVRGGTGAVAQGYKASDPQGHRATEP